MIHASERTLLSLREVLHNKIDLLSIAGLGLLFAAFFRALVGATTFQTSSEVSFLVLACIALFSGLQMICVIGKRTLQPLIAPISMTLGAILDSALGMIIGRSSTIMLTLTLLILGCIAMGLFYRRFSGTLDKEWQEKRKACSYDSLAFPLLYLAAFILVLGSVFGCLFILHVGGLNRGVSQLGFFVGCALAGIVAVGPMIFHPERYLEVLAKIALLFMIAGISLILMLQPSFVSLLVLAIGFCCFLQISFCMVFDYYRCFSLPLLFPVGYLLFLFFSILVGLFIGRLLLLSNSIESLDAFTVASMLLINVISIFGLGSTHRWSARDITSPHNTADPPSTHSIPRIWKDAVEEVANEAGLTKREQEVFALMARGRNASYIEKHLVISNHTARAHILKIYKKLDLHSQQAVIDYIEARVSGKKEGYDTQGECDEAARS